MDRDQRGIGLYFGVVVLLLLQIVALGVSPPLAAAERAPNVLLISVDTLRADRLASYGYSRITSPFIDQLMDEGVRFSDARTVEPLTAPALTSMLTGLHPHEHGATRNGVAMRKDLPSLPKLLKRRGYRTAAFVANWTLRDKISGLGEHFEDYFPVLERKRWLVFASESNADDVNQAGKRWLRAYQAEDSARPYFLWLHYVEPHGPYQYWPQFAARMGIEGDDARSKGNRYDTEIAFADDRIGAMVNWIRALGQDRELLIVFVADHGESLGEHGYTGHGRHVYDATLRVPMAITWDGKIKPGVIADPSLNIDLPATLLSLLKVDGAELFGGWNWAPELLGQAAPSASDRVTYFQSHRGAVKNDENRERVRQNGLLELARIEGGRKEIVRLPSDVHRLYDLTDDPQEEINLVAPKSSPGDDLARWVRQVQQGLALSDELPPPSLEAEDLEQLRALGYLD